MLQAAPGADAAPGALLPGMAEPVGAAGAGPVAQWARPLAAAVPERAHLGREPPRLKVHIVGGSADQGSAAG